MYIVVMLAILQALLPLLHAHPASTPTDSMGSGIHMHDSIGGLHKTWQVPSLQVDQDYLQVIGVGNANEPEQLDLPALATLASFLLIALFFGGSARPVQWSEYLCSPTASPRFSLSRLRAPPLVD